VSAGPAPGGGVLPRLALPLSGSLTNREPVLRRVRFDRAMHTHLDAARHESHTPACSADRGAAVIAERRAHGWRAVALSTLYPLRMAASLLERRS
jgi:hypothetical protein